MEKVRVYEVAKEVGVGNKELVAKIRALGIEVANHMSSLDVEEVQRIKRALDKERQQNLVEERIQPGLTRRRTKSADGPSRPRAQPSGSAGATGAQASQEASGQREAQASGEAAMAESQAASIAQDGHEADSAGDVDSSRGGQRPHGQPAELAQSGSEPRREQSVLHTERHEEHAPGETGAFTPGPQVADPGEGKREPQRHEIAREGQAKAHEGSAPRPEQQPGRVEQRPEAQRPQGQRPESRPEMGRPGGRVEHPRPGQQPSMGAQSGPPQGQRPLPGQPQQQGGPSRLPMPQQFQYGQRPPPSGGMPMGDRRGPAAPRNQAPAGPNRRRELVSKRDLDQRDRFRGKGRKKAGPAGKKQKKTEITMPAQHKRVVKVEDVIAVAELAKQMSVKATEVLKKLFSMGMTSVNINQAIDAETASIIAAEFGYEVSNVAFQEESAFGEGDDAEEDLELRAPVVTIMGHVDHGKTSLLDAIRKANVAGGEAGGITQHIGAYEVSVGTDGRKVVFLDTPGHEAFTAMRARGAEVTDIVILVVAADDGPMPQTIEAINHAKAAEVPIIVAVNKIDKPGANPEKSRYALMEHGLVPSGEMGGDTEFVNVSAKTEEGLDHLLETILLQAEVLELKANSNKPARGVIIEAKLDRARGPMATVLIQDGTLKVGDPVVLGTTSGKVRAMLNDRGEAVLQAGPSTPVEILGLESVPEAGDELNVVADEKVAREVAVRRADKARQSTLQKTSRVSLQDLFAQIKEGTQHELRIVLKADVQGSVEAVKEALTRLSTELVTVKVIHDGVGGITESDVMLAAASKAIIIGFHVRPAGKASSLAEQEKVDVKLYDIIYEAIDEVRKAMVGLLAPERREKVLGRADVRQVFNIPKIGAIAGCAVSEGTIRRSSQVRLVRDSVSVFTGKLASLRRFKDDVREVEKGYECGIGIEGYNDLKVGDIIEAFEFEEIAPTLGPAKEGADKARRPEA